jgi:hypothetical protein
MASTFEGRESSGFATDNARVWLHQGLASHSHSCRGVRCGTAQLDITLVEPLLDVHKNTVLAQLSGSDSGDDCKRHFGQSTQIISLVHHKRNSNSLCDSFGRALNTTLTICFNDSTWSLVEEINFWLTNTNCSQMVWLSETAYSPPLKDNYLQQQIPSLSTPCMAPRIE